MEHVLCQIYYNGEPEMVVPLSMAVTFVAVQCTVSSVIVLIPYVFRHFDLLVQKTTVSNACHEKKLKVKKNFFLCYYSKSLVMKVGTCGY